MGIRTVYDNKQIIMKFINRNYSGYERNKRYNLYIENNALYSYGAKHYYLAKWVENKRNELALYITLYSYDNIAKKQLNLLINLLSNQKVIYRYSTKDGIEGIITMKEILDMLINKFFKARTNKIKYYKCIQGFVNNAINHIEFYDYHLGNEETILNFYELCKTLKGLTIENMPLVILSKIKTPI